MNREIRGFRNKLKIAVKDDCLAFTMKGRIVKVLDLKMIEGRSHSQILNLHCSMILLH